MTDFEPEQNSNHKEEKILPPFGKTWSRLYWIVIINHVIIIILFYIITEFLS